jgi:hypothetical protein
MKTLPIIDFENEYVITDEGNVVDLYDNEIKTTYRMNNFSANLLVVDLYKEGELVLTISIKQLVVLHFFKMDNNKKTINYLDGNTDNNAPYNIEVIVDKDKFVKRYNVYKPAPVYRYNENGPYIFNQDALDEFERNMIENKKEMEEAKKIMMDNKKYYERKVPLKGTPERMEHDKKMKINAKIKSKLDGYKNLCDKFNILFDLDRDRFLEVYDKQNGICYLTDDKINLTEAFYITPIDPLKGFIKDNLQIGKTGPSFRKCFNLPSVERKFNNRVLEEMRDKKIALRVTKQEHSDIERMAKIAGITISEYMREKIF